MGWLQSVRPMTFMHGQITQQLAVNHLLQASLHSLRSCLRFTVRFSWWILLTGRPGHLRPEHWSGVCLASLHVSVYVRCLSDHSLQAVV